MKTRYPEAKNLNAKLGFKKRVIYIYIFHPIHIRSLVNFVYIH